MGGLEVCEGKETISNGLLFFHSRGSVAGAESIHDDVFSVFITSIINKKTWLYCSIRLSNILFGDIFYKFNYITPDLTI